MNIFDNTQKIITAKRLKELRNSKNLSHEKLSEELKQNGIEISIQALKDYEVVNEFHSKFNSTKGMSIEKLFGLAKFYNVSTDYLLGLTDIKSADTTVQGICEYTGLTDGAVDGILACRNLSLNGLNTINFLLNECSEFLNASMFSDEDWSISFPTILYISNYLSSKTKDNNDYYISSNGNLISSSNSNIEDVYDLFNIKNVDMSKIVEKILIEDIEQSLKKSKEQYHLK